jgi:hypothetical protein
MTKLYPLPSPRGTNYEDLRLPPLGAAAAAFARDAAPRARRANDATPSSAKALSALQLFLNERLSPDDQSHAETLVDALLEAAAEPNDPDEDPDAEEQVAAQDRRRKMASDVRREARRMSFDARRRVDAEMTKMFPDAVMPKQYGR